MQKNALLLLLFAGGCDWQHPEGMPEDLAPHAPDGTYRGEIELEVRAFIGPFRVRQEVCTQPFELNVNTGRGVRGRVLCDLGDSGELDVLLVGEIEQMPYVGGDLETDEFAGGWDGWFYDGDRVYGETVGETKTDQGVRIEWFGWFDAVHDPISEPGAGAGGVMVGG
ncbi:MAG: hypothetical protein ACI8PZ_003441 [Myxococcota bacterium]|jgi:hypothetical protein